MKLKAKKTNLLKGVATGSAGASSEIESPREDEKNTESKSKDVNESEPLHILLFLDIDDTLSPTSAIITELFSDGIPD